MIAIIITIMVLELKVPHGDRLAALRPLLPVFLSYVLSFVYVGIYWNNHHHLLHAADRDQRRDRSGRTCTCCSGCRWSRSSRAGWARTTSRRCPSALYGVVLLMRRHRLLDPRSGRSSPTQGPDSTLAAAVGSDLKGKVSPVLYAVAIPLAVRAASGSPARSTSLVALMWLVPDRRIERALQ